MTIKDEHQFTWTGDRTSLSVSCSCGWKKNVDYSFYPEFNMNEAEAEVVKIIDTHIQEVRDGQSTNEQVHPFID